MTSSDRVESAYYEYMHYSTEESTRGLSHYVPFFDQGPVLELAPGRGEFLRLLTDAGITAHGVDLDPGMVATAREADLDVRLGDALDVLRETPPDSLGGVFSAHFVEHLTPDVLREVIAAAVRALRPGGTFVAATPNAGCQSVMGYDFWRDPTHVRFYEVNLLAFLCADAGLEVVETGGNPRNHAGPPPEALAPLVEVQPSPLTELAEAMRAAAAHRGKVEDDSPWLSVNHFLSLQMTRLQQTQQELLELRIAYQALLDRLYPSNEVYVVARRPQAPGADGA